MPWAATAFCRVARGFVFEQANSTISLDDRETDIVRKADFLLTGCCQDVLLQQRQALDLLLVPAAVEHRREY